jgi:hypothetical protein
MRYLLGLLCLGVIGLGGCADQQREATATTTSTNTVSSPPIPPAELSAALLSLCNQVQRQVGQAALILEERSPSNQTRRETLRWRLRIADVCRQARARDNAMAGLIELWFWATASEQFFRAGSGKTQFGEHQDLVTKRVGALVSTCEQVVRRAVPKDRFDGLKKQIVEAAANGDAYLAGDSTQANPIGSLLEVTRLEGVLNLALSPFNVFTGVKAGGDAASRLAVTADRAVDLLSEYPQLLDWHLQAAALELQDQDATQAMLAEIKRTNTSLEAALALTRELPTQLRNEGLALLDQSRPAQADVRETLKALTEAATALERLNTGVDHLIARFTPSETSDKAAPSATEPAARPFDIREYTAALNAAAVAARDLQQTLNATDHLLASPAIPNRLAEADQTAHGLIATIGTWSIALLLTLTACVVIAVRLLRR